ncbi:diguanylate cyclase domain-containing protein [Roseibium sp.]|uniref:diguanylate cyclase domain-containing protein n=1 Tax=Roseibium sp. TaxID=1936156 RepID=UPI003A97C24F
MPTVYMSLLDVLPMPAAFLTPSGHCRAMNAVLADLLGLNENHIGPENDPAVVLFAREDRTRLEHALRLAEAGRPVDIEGSFSSPAGRLLASRLSLVPMSMEEGASPLLLLRLTADSMGETRTSPLAGLHSDRIVEQFPDELILFDDQSDMSTFCDRLEQACGSEINRDELAHYLETCRSGRVATFYVQDSQRIGSMGGNAKEHGCEVRMLRVHDGARMEASVLAIVRKGAVCPGEIDEYKRLAMVDPVTNIANRRALDLETDRLLRLASDTEDGGDVAVLGIDLDDFKQINDLAGHAAGDEMLRLVAGAIAGVVRGKGVAGRLGGDEFGCVIPVSGKAEAEGLAGQIRDALSRLHLHKDGRVFTIRGSIGVCICAGGGAVPDAASLFHQADMGCMKGKAAGGGAVITVDYAGGGTLAPATQPNVSGSKLDAWLDHVELRSIPVFSLVDNKVLGARVALHLGSQADQMGTSGIERSGRESQGLRAQVDCWALDQILDFLKSNRTCKWCSLSVSAASYDNKAFRDLLSMRLSNDPLLAGRLCVEVNERDYLREPGRTQMFLSGLSDYGCQTSVGDFAGHWPVFEGLSENRVDWIRLKPDLTAMAAVDRRKRAILKGLICAARELGIRVIAQDVEREADSILMASLDIDGVEGALYGEAEPWTHALPGSE